MTDTVHLGLPTIEGAQAQKHVTHNEALVVLDALVMLAVIDRDLSAPPGSPAEGDRYLVKSPGSGAFAGRDNEVAHYIDSGWSFYPPQVGWICYVGDEAKLVAWDGASWQVVSGETITELQNLARLGLGTTADATNPFAAKLNNALWVAKAVAEGGDGDLRYKLSKESAAKTLSLLFQTAFSGRAEIGLTGDDDFHFKTSPDGSAWIDALLLDKTTGSTKVNAGFFLTGDLSPPQITADQNDYNPTGLATACVLRLSSDATRKLTGLSGGGDGRVVIVGNVGSYAIVLRAENASSAAANRFGFDDDLILRPKETAALQYDATLQRWISLTPARRWTLSVITASNAAWPVPAGAREMILELWGGGGSGGAQIGGTTRGTGGGAGGYALKHYKGMMDATLNVTIGAGGAAVTGSGNPGNAGGTTSVSGTNLGAVSATGGGGGAAGINSGGSGGIGSGGDVNIKSEDGGTNSWIGATAIGFGGSAARGGGGGLANVGAPGGIPGGGGAGGNHSPPDSASGAGARGEVHIWTR